MITPAFFRRVRCLALLALLLASPLSPCRAELAETTTFWPLFDYREDPATGAWRLGLLGPLGRISSAGGESSLALRPLFYRAATEESSSLDVLYPLYHRERDSEGARTGFFQLYRGDWPAEGPGTWTLFPLFFRTLDAAGEPDFACFPLGGSLHQLFGRDRIDFVLFPLWSRTEREGVATTHVLWPLFSRASGEGVSGGGFWPLAGTVERVGVAQKSFVLWPLWYRQKERLDTDQPVSREGVFPFWMHEQSPALEQTIWLWPFFSAAHNHAKGYRETWFPWPLLRRVEGPGYESERYLPFYADDRAPGRREQWWGWPLCKREQWQWEGYARQRWRVLYFFYSHLSEGPPEAPPTLERQALWPLFTWERRGEVERFHSLSLLEPFFPDNAALERSWSPLWRVYQQVRLADGTTARSLLWNLYWQESRGEDSAGEIFPLLSWRKDVQAGEKEFKVLKGLLGYHRDAETIHVYLFYFSLSI